MGHSRPGRALLSRIDAGRLPHKKKNRVSRALARASRRSKRTESELADANPAERAQVSAGGQVLAKTRRGRNEIECHIRARGIRECS